MFQVSLMRRIPADAIVPGLESRAKFNSPLQGDNAESL